MVSRLRRFNHNRTLDSNSCSLLKRVSKTKFRNYLIITNDNCSRTAKDIKIYLGTITTHGDGWIYDSELLIKHEEFSLNPVRNDIGLIKLKKNITFTNNIKPIRISDQFIADKLMTVSCGWGFSNNSNQSPEILQYLEQTTITNDECAEKVNSNNLYENNLCAFDKKGVGMCNGDSGSPLVAKDLQIGIASWVKLPCASGRPDVYVRAANYLPWISLKVYSN